MSKIKVAEDRIGNTDDIIKTLRYIGRELRMQGRDAEAIIIAACAQSLLNKIKALS